jgi:polyribonucleotide nucleotidyltransferase
MKIKFFLSVILAILILTSCNIFTKKIEEYAENKKNEILKDFGINQQKRDSLIKNGKKSKGEITEVEDTQTTLNNNPKVILYVKVMPENEDEFDAKITTYVSRVKIPRKGDKVFVYYNPNDKTDIIVE